MKAQTAYFYCGDHLRCTLSSEIEEVLAVVDGIEWVDSFTHEGANGAVRHQAAYNRAMDLEFVKRGWESQPVLCKAPRLGVDFRKGPVFVEVQFGNSATLYRDYYKFQYGLTNGLLSLAVLIVPVNPAAFFPARPASSVNNMADYTLAYTCLTVLPINVPTMLIGLLPDRSDRSEPSPQSHSGGSL